MTDLTTIKDRITSEISSIIDQGAKILKIETVEQYESVKKLGNAAHKKAKELDEERLEKTKPLRYKVDEINATYKEFTDKLGAFVTNMKTVVVAYDKEQERKRLEEQRKADEEARKQREKIEAEARAQREKEEAERRKAEEARAAEEAARLAAQNAKDEEERKRLEAEAEARRKEAEKAESKADNAAAKAETKEMVAETVVAPVVEIAGPKKVVSTITTYSVEITDKAELVRWLIANEMIDGLSLIDVNIGALNKIVTAAKGKIRVAGVTIVTGENYRMRSV